MTGVVVATNVVPTRTRRHNTPEICYLAQIKYRYNVDGADHTSSRVSFDGRRLYKTPEAAEEEFHDCPVGKKVMVFYDPAKPDSSVLVRGVKGGNYLIFAGGIFFIFLGVAFVFCQGIRIRGRIT